MKNLRCFVLGVSVLTTPVTGLALDGSIRLGAGLEHTDNSLRVNANEQSDLEQIVSADINLEHEGSEVVAKVGYSAEHSDFDKNTQDDDTTITGDASIVYEQISQQLFWTVENSRRNIIRDEAAIDVQENREDRSISNISPQLILRPSSVDSIDTRLNYSTINYEDSSDQDSKRVGANIYWNRNLSKVDTLSFGGSYQDVTFDDEINDYEYSLVSISYQAVLARINYKIAVGYNESARETGDVDGGYLRIDAGYEGGGSTWDLNVTQELTDTSRQNNNDDLSGIDESGNSAGDFDVIDRSSMQLDYLNENLCGVCSFRASIIYEIEDYETLENDSDELGVRLALDYRLNRLMTLRGGVHYSDFTFKGNNVRADYDSVEYNLGLRHEITRALSLSYRLIYSDRDSAVDTGDYTELRGGITLNYLID
ncbi:outer membrane beta-barrel protein [Oceanicoccus sp. KOV_DT_Chl]|uniref:outer membrane beta-barrel protein n=1 Tax=Oceanicoccus sp. KOV_DT_Chl TaxID=1904639 RepID=UPI000C7E63B5|nr:outer membrane beta-barrel protein [Oceanicoccus sp. KOV_DT_Chl]